MKTNYEYGVLMLFAFKNVKYIMFIKYNQLGISNKLKCGLESIHYCLNGVMCTYIIHIFRYNILYFVQII